MFLFTAEQWHFIVPFTIPEAVYVLYLLFMSSNIVPRDKRSRCFRSVLIIDRVQRWNVFSAVIFLT